jgi:2-amino-4-hydroxy-6-hydroxymethyldihydropteridine diphosphokinase
MNPTRVYLALGTNIGNRLENLKVALHSLPPDVIPLRISNVYETPPWGILDQPPFLNMAAEVETNLNPRELLVFLKSVEKKMGRKKVIRNGPRLIDLDILFYGDQVVHDDDLEIPHPRMTERSFVLVPLADLAPDFIHPLLGESVSDLLAKVEKQGVELYPLPEDIKMTPDPAKTEMPQEFIEALEKAPAAAQKFYRLPPSHQKEYLDYILEAKKPETRLSRIEKVIATLSQPRPHP